MDVITVWSAKFGSSQRNPKGACRLVWSFLLGRIGACRSVRFFLVGLFWSFLFGRAVAVWFRRSFCRWFGPVGLFFPYWFSSCAFYLVGIFRRFGFVVLLWSGCLALACSFRFVPYWCVCFMRFGCGALVCLFFTCRFGVH